MKKHDLKYKGNNSMTHKDDIHHAYEDSTRSIREGINDYCTTEFKKISSLIARQN